MIALSVRAGLVAGAFAFLAGCQGVPADYKPDPKLKTASPAALKGRVVSACVITQKGKSSVSTAEASKACGCYADRTFKAMDKAEIDFYRANGYFADSARPKAEASQAACKLA